MSTLDAHLDAMDDQLAEAKAEAEPEPTVAQPKSEEEFVAELDAALERREHFDRVKDGIEQPEPEPEPERDYSKVVAAAVDLDVSLGYVATPDRFKDVDLKDEDAIRARLLELQQGEDTAEAWRQAMYQAEVSEFDAAERAEQARADARVILDEGDTGHVWRAASIIQEQHPDLLDAFVAEWTETDPDAASVWASQHPPVDWGARKAEAAWQLEEAQNAVEQEQAAERIGEIGKAFDEREKELLADPQTAPYVDGAMNLIASQVEADPSMGIGSPEEAKRLLDASVKTVRSAIQGVREARSDAKLLAGIDEMIHRQEALREEEETGYHPGGYDPEAGLDRTTDEIVNARGLRGPRQDPDPLLASLDAALDEREERQRLADDWPPGFVKRQEELRQARLQRRRFR